MILKYLTENPGIKFVIESVRSFCIKLIHQFLNLIKTERINEKMNYQDNLHKNLCDGIINYS